MLVAGRIRDEDIALVREKTPIADVIGEHVQLRNAGGGNLKGLCPFHDEKSPSLSVSPAKGLFHCFGCVTGGDVKIAKLKLERDLQYQPAAADMPGDWHVPDDSCFMLGDNTGQSRDSRAWRGRVFRFNDKRPEIVADESTVRLDDDTTIPTSAAMIATTVTHTRRRLGPVCRPRGAACAGGCILGGPLPGWMSVTRPQ